MKRNTKEFIIKNNKKQIDLIALRKTVLQEVRKLAAKYGLMTVNYAVSKLKNERTAQKELEAAEKKVAELKKVLN